MEIEVAGLISLLHSADALQEHKRRNMPAHNLSKTVSTSTSENRENQTVALLSANRFKQALHYWCSCTAQQVVQLSHAMISAHRSPTWCMFVHCAIWNWKVLV